MGKSDLTRGENPVANISKKNRKRGHEKAKISGMKPITRGNYAREMRPLFLTYLGKSCVREYIGQFFPW